MSTTKGVLRTVSTGQRVEFSFNPSQVVVKKTAKWTPKPATTYAEAPVVEFGGTEQRVVTMQVLFDELPVRPTGPSVLQRVELLMSWTNPTPASLQAPATAPSPPHLLLDWGGGLAGGTHFYLKDVTATYTMFKEAGDPLRATADLTLASIPNDPPAQNPTSGSEPGTRAVVPVGGDSLASLAFGQYGDAGLWRALAEANGIDDPLRLPAGSTLLVPPSHTARRLSAKPGPAPRA